MSIVTRSLSYIHPDKDILFQDLNLSVAKGEKAALVGTNGAGKSTLLQVIAGRLQPSGGEVLLSEMPFYMPQYLGQYDDHSVAQVLGIADKLEALYAILEGDVSPDHFACLGDDWDIEERVQAALSHWHLQHLPLSQTMQLLSGGEKTKVFLAALLIHAPGIILLDEPSNHLDSESRALLYDFIQKTRATILVVSHDRTLLNLLPATLELDKSAIELYGGNYDFYLQQQEGKVQALQSQLEEKEKVLRQAQQKAREVAAQRQKQEARDKKQSANAGLPRILAGTRKSNAEQSTAKLSHIHNEKINDLAGSLKQLRTEIKEYHGLKINLEGSGLHKGKILANAKEINFSYEEKPLWSSPVSFQVCSGDRVRIEGNNGTGKTTLLKMMTGKLQPSVGELQIADFRYWYLDQDYSIINNGLTAFEQVQQFNERHLPEHELKILLHQHHLTRELWDKKCAVLSGGERMKLILCALVVGNNKPDLLILDEPTNNLDVQSQEVLTRAVKAFTGSVWVISHDQFFIDAIKIDKSIRLN